MSDITIKTNKKPRESVYYPTGNARQDKQIESAYGGLIDLDGAEFVFYRDYPYFMGDCMRLEGNHSFGKYWHGYFDDTFFSCILVHINDDGTYVFGFAYS